MGVGYRNEIENSLKHFTRLVAPATVNRITTKTIDAYVAARAQETTVRSGKKLGPRDGKTYKGDPKRKREPIAHNLVSPATVNKELRTLRAILNTAHDWGYLAKVPKFKMLKEPKRLPQYVTPEDFAAIYTACGTAKRPAEQDQGYTSADWWRALVTFAYLTGWRIGEILAVTWDDVSLDDGLAITRAEDNKGGRDERAPLHPLVVEHLRTIISFDNMGNRVFWWPHNHRTLWTDFADIQKEAGIDLPCAKRHTHVPGCHRYGFHDFRRGFASMNALSLGGDALQSLMRHRSYETTKKYINMADGLKGITDRYFVPQIPEVSGEK